MVDADDLRRAGAFITEAGFAQARAVTVMR